MSDIISDDLEFERGRAWVELPTTQRPFIGLHLEVYIEEVDAYLTPAQARKLAHSLLDMAERAEKRKEASNG